MARSETAATFDTQSKDNSAAIRKYTKAIIFVAPITAPEIENITTAGDGGKVQLAKVPQEYTPIGLIKKDDGIEFSADRDTSEVESLGYAAPTRTDITKETSTLAFTPHETNKLVEQLYYGLDLTDVKPDASTGEVSFAKPTLPATIYYRVLVVGVDGAGDQEFFKAWAVPRGQITETESTSMSAEDEASYGMAPSADPDSERGYSARTFEGGSGHKDNLAELGWTKPADGGDNGDGGDGGDDSGETQALTPA